MKEAVFEELPTVKKVLERVQQTEGSVTYRIAGNFGGSKLWQMVLNLRFGEFNFGDLS